MKFHFDWKEYGLIARKASAESAVLIKNDNDALPLKKGEKVAIFGRTQFDYIKSGTGSGGLVKTPYVVNYYDGLKNAGHVEIDENVTKTYQTWLSDHPFDKGVGWAQEPWSQVEMPLDDSFVKDAASRNDAAIIIIGRLSGEDKDNKNEAGSYLLKDDELAMLETVCKNFKRSIVLINSGNIIDMKWVETIKPAAVMYVWQGGCEGGNAAADLVCGFANPSGRLADTIANDITDYPCEGNFGDPFIAIYKEDIFVGYRYFETFARDKVMYPFGYGLSYTTFETSSKFTEEADKVKVETKVTNTGKCAGKHVVEVYFKAPSGKLGKAARELADYAKTNELKPGESETLSFYINKASMKAYDDEGLTGHKCAFVLEAGTYEIYAGDNVRDAKLAGTFEQKETVVVEETTEALAPMKAFDRFVEADGKITLKPVPLRKDVPNKRRDAERALLKELPYNGKSSLKLKDVYDKKVTLDEFVASLTDTEMMQMTRGEGMSSPKVTPGTAAAFAGSSDSLVARGIPSLCCTDGPSGLRIDSGIFAMQGPNGTALACTFNKNIVEKLYEYMGRELRKDNIDSLLGPGMNIHRSPLNGRNFEYFSEDPYLTGSMAVAELKGLHANKVTGTIKHFACNNQEIGRHTVDSVVSMRALREIYLKGYEMAVKEGGAYNIMTTYGILNGTHTSGSFDLNTSLLRKDWKYEGLVMTDWWTNIGDEGEQGDRSKTPYMIMAQNDIYMVNRNPERNDSHDQAEEGLKNGIYTRAELQRNCKNILKVALNSASFDKQILGLKDEFEVLNAPERSLAGKIYTDDLVVNGSAEYDCAKLHTGKDEKNAIHVHLEEAGEYEATFEVSANGSDLAQIPLTVSLNGTVKKVVLLNGADHEWHEHKVSMESSINIDVYLEFEFGQDGMSVRNLKVYKTK